MFSFNLTALLSDFGEGDGEGDLVIDCPVLMEGVFLGELLIGGSPPFNTAVGGMSEMFLEMSCCCFFVDML